jgi:hypothetical protein|tara:strand:+ start:36 stop:479 length:444 start_codon:yes stop_codon:yes gene_type:complete
MPSKYGFGNSRKKSPYKMNNKPAYAMDQKNPMMMDKPMKFNADLKQASADGKLSGKFKEAVDNSAMDMYGNPHKMHGDKPMKKYASDAQRKAVHAGKADGGAGNPNKMMGIASINAASNAIKTGVGLRSNPRTSGSRRRARRAKIRG